MFEIGVVILRKMKDKIYVNISDNIDLKFNDEIIVETENGIEYGIFYKKIINNINEFCINKNKILRKVTNKDIKKNIKNEEKSLKANKIVLKKIIEYNLNMKLTCVQYIFDCSKLFVYYTSELRVDFRDFIKDLGHILKTRIQMVQIGVRDEAKIIGGIGMCGNTLCCKRFLKDFNPVTIDMAKKQNLLLNVQRLSGLCGRLMCCISYDNNKCIKNTKDCKDICIKEILKKKKKIF
jgi:cell fate regulator YaaT (PSP1 superfamily)